MQNLLREISKDWKMPPVMMLDIVLRKIIKGAKYKKGSTSNNKLSVSYGVSIIPYIKTLKRCINLFFA
jgi:hypothetical protein